MNKTGRLASLAGLAVAFIWGLTFLSIKVAVRELRPMNLTLLRFIIATLLLLPIARISRTPLSVAKRDLPLLAAGGIVGITLYFLFENNGIMRLSASESSIIIGAIPVLTLIIECVLYRTKLKASLAVGILMSFGGVALMVLRSESARSSPAGYFYMIGAALCWAAYSFLTKPLGDRYPLLAVTFWQFLFGTLACVPFAVAEGQDFGRISTAAALNVLYLGVLGSAVGYWLYVIVLDRLGAAKASVFINLIPVVSIAASFVVLGERLSGLQLAGAAAVIAGVYFATSF